MDALPVMGKALIILGAGMVLLGLLFVFLPRLPLADSLGRVVGRLPGDILIQRDGFIFFFPLATCIVLSLVLTLLFNIIPRLFR